MSTRRVWAIALAAGLAACSPSLNWRTVPVERLVALLPCKPDHAERQVVLDGVSRTLSMWGCEAGGALFAVSHLRVDASAQAESVIAAWQLTALSKMPGATPQAIAFKAPAVAGQMALQSAMVRASGKRPDGQAVQAQLAWFTRGADVYHLAVYAATITPAMSEPFFTELQWQ